MATWDRYKGAIQTGFDVELSTGTIFNPRSYCDDPTLGPVGIYIAKGPVCHLALDPLTQFVNTNIAWDISASGSATSTIDTFDIDWEGATDIGDIVAGDWSSDPLSGNVQFTTAGVYTVTATVTDLLGQVSSPVKMTVTIVDTLVSSDVRVYVGVIGTTNEGVYLLTEAGGMVKISTGLSAGHLNVRPLRLHPFYKSLPGAQQHVWAPTADGAAFSTDGGATWSTISKATLGTPNNDAGDSPAPATADLDQIDIALDPQDPLRVYVVRSITTPNIRTWLYSSDDYGATWDNEQVGVT